MLEPKARNEMTDPEVFAKRDVAVTWCRHANGHAVTYSGKPWKYVLIPHDAIVDNMTVTGLAAHFTCDLDSH
jgi:type III restriction enzyme